jgi:hypothetical protein
MESYINIEACDLIQVITKIKIKVINLILNSSATIEVKCFSDDDRLLNTYFFELKQPDYSELVNDYFLINYVCEKYGFTIKNVSI